MSEWESAMVTTPVPADWVASGRTALCVVDVQVDFASPDGVLAQYDIDMSVLVPTLQNINRLLVSARAAGVPVIFIALRTSAETDSSAWKLWMQRQGRDPEAESAICRDGEAGSDFYYCLPQPEDLCIEKSRYSAFWNTELDRQLREHNLDTLVVTGLTTECCVESTVRDAFHHDYQIIVPADACAAYETDMHLASLKAMSMNCAIISETSALTDAWEVL